MAQKMLTGTGKVTPEQLQEECVHHWIIDSPSGPASRGSCRKCGAEKDFPNTIADSTWGKWEDDDLISS